MDSTIRIIAGTGHRPNKLGGYEQPAFNLLVQIATEHLLDRAPKRVISGMALGWDQALASAATALGIPWAAYIPFLEQPNTWPYLSQHRYHTLLKHAAEVKFISPPGYKNWKMHKRNEAMVKDCTEMAAMYNGSGGGTWNCICYAEHHKRHIINLYDKWKERSGSLQTQKV